MLILENLVKIGNEIHSDYLPGSEAEGSVVFNTHNKEIESVKCEGCDTKSIYGFKHLVNVLGMMVDYNKYPQRYEYYWY